jgi:ribosomal protein S18 acetylase RimI-like enzyme
MRLCNGLQTIIVLTMLTDSALIKVRRAKASDSEALARVYQDSWQNAYTGIIPYTTLDVMTRRRDAAWWRNAIRSESHLLVIEVAGVLAGYATCGAARQNRPQKGEIYELYIAPVYQGVGLGEYLFEACRHQLDLRGLPGLIVWALAENEAAIEFYRRRGGRPVARSTERFGKTTLPKVALGWT